MGFFGSLMKLLFAVCTLFYTITPTDGFVTVSKNGQIQLLGPINVDPQEGFSPQIRFRNNGTIQWVATTFDFYTNSLVNNGHTDFLLMTGNQFSDWLLSDKNPTAPGGWLEYGSEGRGTFLITSDRKVYLNTTLSVFRAVELGSSLSVRGFVKMDKRLSVDDKTYFGAELFIGDPSKSGSRSQTRFGRGNPAGFPPVLKVDTQPDPPNRYKTSITDQAVFGDSLDIRNSTNLGSCLSVQSFARLYNTLSVNSYVRIGQY